MGSSSLRSRTHRQPCAHAGVLPPAPAPRYLSHLIFFFQPGLGPGFFLILGSSAFLASLLSLFLLETLQERKKESGLILILVLVLPPDHPQVLSLV